MVKIKSKTAIKKLQTAEKLINSVYSSSPDFFTDPAFYTDLSLCVQKIKNSIYLIRGQHR